MLEEDDPDTVGRMLEYIYTLGYCEKEKQSISTPGESMEQDDTTATADDTGVQLLNNVYVYAIADKYFIEGLKQMAKEKFQSQAESLLFVGQFAEIIRELYGSTMSSDRGLRDIVSRICAQQGKTIIDSPHLSASIVENGEFGLDILRETVKNGEESVEKATTKSAALREKVEKKKDQITAIKTTMTRLVKDIEADRISENRGFWRD